MAGPRVRHLDIKPENVILANDMDGVQQQQGSIPRHCCGTFPFMAPEVTLLPVSSSICTSHKSADLLEVMRKWQKGTGNKYEDVDAAIGYWRTHQ
mmetsp:Transcript_157672/g.278298  ORF Transcript_157672/g.278298 Transcript_157672/m.278298 type:complete len:95 (+) Transcript_157672:93-377(+)